MSFNIERALFLPFSKLRNIVPMVVFAINMILFVIFKNYAVFWLLLLFLFIQWGYVYISAHNELNDNTELIPKWDILKCLSVFFINFLIKLCYALILIPIGIVLYFLLVLFSSPFIAILTAILIIPFAIAFNIFMFYAEFSYLKTLKFGDAFKFAQNMYMLKFGFKEAIFAYLWSLLLSLPIILVVGVVIFIVGVLPLGIQYLITQSLDIFSDKHLFSVLKLVVEIVLGFYTGLMSFCLMAQAYKNTESSIYGVIGNTENPDSY